MHSIPPTPDPASTCPADGCGLPAVQSTSKTMDKYLHEMSGVCKRGHLWTTKWFAGEAV